MDEITPSNKKSRNILQSFKDLDLFGKATFGFLAIFFVSLFVGGVFLFFQQQPFLENAWLSFREPESPEELTLEKLYNRKDLGKELPLSEDGCLQRSYRIEFLGEEDDHWLVEIDGCQESYLAVACPEARDDVFREGNLALLILENCNNGFFPHCFPILHPPAQWQGEDIETFYIKNYPQRHIPGGIGTGFFTRLETNSSEEERLFLFGTLLSWTLKKLSVETEYGVVELAVPSGGVYRLVGSKDGATASKKVTKGEISDFLGQRVTVYLDGSGDSLVIEKIALIGEITSDQ